MSMSTEFLEDYRGTDDDDRMKDGHYHGKVHLKGNLLGVLAS